MLAKHQERRANMQGRQTDQRTNQVPRAKPSFALATEKKFFLAPFLTDGSQAKHTRPSIRFKGHQALCRGRNLPAHCLGYGGTKVVHAAGALSTPLLGLIQTLRQQMLLP